ncbi:MAG: hypothetical protein R3C68_10335 [Myxococcota bacterium]
MKSALNKALLGALIVQAALVLWAFSARDQPSPGRSRQVMENLDVEAVNHIEISQRSDTDNDSGTLTLDRRGNKWLVTNQGDYEADAKLVKDF